MSMSHESFTCRSTKFGQLVIGPPGSGKSTYCMNLHKYLNKIGRKCIIVNLDPGSKYDNNNETEIDITHLITSSDAMKHKNLGPNGALLYCLQYLNENINWLTSQIINYKSYCLFDCPGQVEFYTHHQFLVRLIKSLTTVGYQLCTINLIDSHFCAQPTKFTAALFLTLNTMLTIGLPQINILSKADLLEKYDSHLKFNKHFYTEVINLHLLLDNAQCIINDKYLKLNSCLLKMVEESGLLNFHPLNSQSEDSLQQIIKVVDKANGYFKQHNLQEKVEYVTYS